MRLSRDEDGLRRPVHPAGQQPDPARARRRAGRAGARARVSRHRRDRRAGGGYFYAPTLVAGLRAGRRAGPHGDLRPGDHGAAVHRRGRGGAAGQRHDYGLASSVWTRDHGTRAADVRGDSTRAACGSTATSRWWPRCRTAGSSSRATARTCRRTRWRTTRGSSTSCPSSASDGARYGAQFGPDITFLGVPRALGRTRTYAGADVVILGAPFDGGTSYRPGARFGPQACG